MAEFGDTRLPPRFWSKVNPHGPLWNGTPCWVWMAFRNRDGYGRFGIIVQGSYTSRFAHRIAYETLVAPITEGLEPDHLCRNPACVNPAHLEPVTHHENILRGDAGKYNSDKTHCYKGHPFDLHNTGHHGNKRYCKACARLYQREKNRLRPKGTCPKCGNPCTKNAQFCKLCRPKKVLVQCPQGHLYTPENTYVYRGMRSCKTCRLLRARAKNGGALSTI